VLATPQSSDRPWNDATKTAAERAELLLAHMSTQDKVHMLHGDCMSCSCPYVGVISANNRLGIPALNTHDGPQGFRNKPLADASSTSWPGAMAMAATFDPDAVHEWGAAMGKEFRAKGANVQLGPGLNLARVPANGRNFEYLSGEDPYLGYVLAKQVVKGIQEQGIIATGKHWVVNSQEEHRYDVSEDADERTLFEMYYPPFEGAIEAGLGSMMCSYNRINGTYSCENPMTLGHLRDKLGFQGFVMSDWYATHSASLRQGLDMEMPFGIAINSFSLTPSEAVSTAEIDTSVRRILRVMFEMGIMDAPPSTWNSSRYLVNVSTPKSITQARRFGAESTVLLKNAGGLLPLPAGARLALIGFASENALALAYGHGSGEVRPSSYVSPLSGIRAAAGAGSEVLFDDGVDMERAKDLARSSDFAIVFVGASASEGGDRENLALDGHCATWVLTGTKLNCTGNDAHQNDMVSKVAQANPKTIVVASVPGAFLMPWLDDVAAVLTNFMPGQEVGNAIADVLFGRVNPSAKLPITLPNVENEVGFSAQQYPGALGGDGLHHAAYAEKLLVGYRYYEANSISFTKGFPFGHGLSYTSFVYSDLAVQGRSVSLTVANAGAVAGREVAQLYLAFPEAAGEPPLLLRGFHRTALLAPGQQERVAFELRERDTSVWDAAEHGWAPVRGTFGLLVGSSSRDLRLRGALEL